MFKIIIRPQAQADLDEAALWHEARYEGRGKRLLEEVESKLPGLMNTPEMHQCFFLDLRKSNLKKFPYSLVYRVLQSEKIVEVLAFVHFRQDDSHWLSRI